MNLFICENADNTAQANSTDDECKPGDKVRDENGVEWTVGIDAEGRKFFSRIVDSSLSGMTFTATNSLPSTAMRDKLIVAITQSMVMERRGTAFYDDELEGIIILADRIMEARKEGGK